MKNIILLSDGYKLSHWLQYPFNTEKVYSYCESRHGAKWPELVFFGLQYCLKEYLEGKRVTKEFIDEAEQFSAEYFGNNKIFNREGWEYILNKHNGHLPVRIKAVAEGSVVPTNNVLLTIENTDPKCYWLTNYLETILLESIWYGSTVATQSREIKMIFLNFMEETGADKSLIDFKMCDFGFRGVSSVESAGLGGAAHLVSFKGTDTLEGVMVARKYYGCPMAGYSIPAAEHSTITSWGRDNECQAFANMLEKYPSGLVAVVSDSYDIENALRNYWGKLLKDKILSRDGCVVIRPDSGPPAQSVVSTLEILGEVFGFKRNHKNYKVLPPQLRVIQGDGIDIEIIPEIFAVMKTAMWSADNIAFGSGGGLLQKLNRDTCRFAFKCSSVTVNGIVQDVYKTPTKDRTKSSKRGRLKLVYDGQFKTVNENDPGEDMLHEVFRDGKILRETTFDEVRTLAFVS